MVKMWAEWNLACRHFNNCIVDFTDSKILGNLRKTSLHVSTLPLPTERVAVPIIKNEVEIPHHLFIKPLV